MDIRKVYLLILLCTFCILSPVYTQQSLSDEFRKVAGDYAALYTSKVEVGYSPYLYINHPYWDTDEFKKGAVCYGGLVYTDLQLRYDTFKKQLIVITPCFLFNSALITASYDFFHGGVVVCAYYGLDIVLPVVLF